MDMRLWSREIITELLKMYKENPCLWKIKSDSYKNKNLRERAYEKMVQYCKEHGFPEATKDFVVKKIQSLRGSFRKELRRVEAKLRCGQGDKYEPSLWYFDLLLFTKDQELPNDSDTEEACERIREESRVSASGSYKWRDYERSHYKQEYFDGSKGESSRTRNSSNGRRYLLYSLHYNNESPSCSPQRKRRSEDSDQTALRRSDREVALNSSVKLLTEHEAFGINVARKLDKMDETQAIYAESLITSVLRDGLFKKLHDESAICSGGCGPNSSRKSTRTLFVATPSPPSIEVEDDDVKQEIEYFNEDDSNDT